SHHPRSEDQGESHPGRHRRNARCSLRNRPRRKKTSRLASEGDGLGSASSSKPRLPRGGEPCCRCAYSNSCKYKRLGVRGQVSCQGGQPKMTSKGGPAARQKRT